MLSPGVGWGAKAVAAVRRPCGAKEGEVRKPWRFRVKMLRWRYGGYLENRFGTRETYPFGKGKNGNSPARMGICDPSQEGRW